MLNPPANAPISTPQADLNRIRKHLKTLVEIESPSGDGAAINQVVDAVESIAVSLGASAVRHTSAVGDALELRFPGSGSGAASKPVMLLGHLDTVWPLGTLAKMPYHEAPDSNGQARIWGPGTLDMKCGVVMALEAIALIAELDRPPVIFCLGQDEEVGSHESRTLIERLALESQAVFVLEPAQGMSPAAYKTARKGVGVFRIDVKGIAAHAGVDFGSGHSAIVELAKLLLQVQRFCDPANGITVNPGVIAGGTRSNVIAADAWAEVDVRIVRVADGERLDTLFHNLRCEDSACSVSISGGINRPPMERSEGTVRLFQMAQTCAQELGFDLQEAATGGGSDGNFTAAIGVPTLDGMGAVGEGAHAVNESVLVEHLVPRTMLLAKMIAGLK